MAKASCLTDGPALDVHQRVHDRLPAGQRAAGLQPPHLLRVHQLQLRARAQPRVRCLNSEIRASACRRLLPPHLLLVHQLQLHERAQPGFRCRGSGCRVLACRPPPAAAFPVDAPSCSCATAELQVPVSGNFSALDGPACRCEGRLDAKKATGLTKYAYKGCWGRLSQCKGKACTGHHRSGGQHQAAAKCTPLDHSMR